MKKWIAALLALPLSCLQAQTPVDDFDDIQLWAGSGTNQAALVLQWNDGANPASFVWGFRWNGETTGLQMLTAVAGSTLVREAGGGDTLETLAGADPRLSLVIERYGFGDAVYSLVFNDAGIVRTAADWSAGYWQYSLHGGTFEYSTYNWQTDTFEGPFLYDVSGTQSYAAVAWTESQIGASDRQLVDGAWDAWSFAPGFVGVPLSQPSSAGLPLPAVAMAFKNGLPVVECGTVPGLDYGLQWAESPDDAWTSVGATQAGDGGVLEFADTTTPLPPRRFYRIAVSESSP